MMMGCVTSWGGRLASCLTIASVAAGATFATIDSAEARSKHRAAKRSSHVARPMPASTFTGAPNYSALVVDAKTGRVLFEQNADETRFPASVTKVMTLYLVFEDLERSRLGLQSRITMTSHCAAQAPSKLGLRPGQTISVEDGIKAVVTKSANDIACAFAENLEGSEPAFAERMTRKARALGMYKTVYRNASGLPNPNHVTSARDLVTLGRAIQDRFPRYYGYFGTRVFTYAGRAMPNHNKLLGRVEGVDGIKTGYTNASGFNLLTSVKSQGRSIVAVIMGGRTGPSRDAHMRELIALNLPRAQPGSRTAPLVAENGDRGAPARMTRPAVMASVPTPLSSQVVQAPERVASLDPIPPMPTPAPQPSPSVATSGATPKAAPRNASAPAQPAVAASIRDPEEGAATPQSMRWVVGRQPTVTGSVPSSTASDAQDEAELVSPEPAAQQRRVRVASRDVEAAPQPAPAAETAPIRKGWLIQIGATTEAAGAQALLSNAKAKGGRVLSGAEPFTETYMRGDRTYYRARFAGLNERSADAACKALKRSSVSCFAIKN
ncbi:MAG TPA: SPOR domain-containing protein [Hansschlegelia sp.]